MRKVLFMWGILSDGDTEWMIEAGCREAMPVGSVLIREGKPSDKMFVLLSGTLSISAGETELIHLRRGEVVGEVSFVDSRPPSATVKAVSPCFVLSIPRYKLSKKLQHDVGFAARFYQAVAIVLADRVRETNHRREYGLDATLKLDAEYEDELNPDVLELVALAGARFTWMLKRLDIDMART